ncbi:MAG: hypothetical protein IKQ75_05055 [Bacteroidales bacterium]|nr:hypothetical protein [Bacteroidales bacterium]MBR6161218.1 hypothetical protein [Bacteroidales bacterium]
MRRLFLLGLICFLCLFSLQGQETTQPKVVAGFNGGMMVHTGYLQGTLPEIGYHAQGAPFGLGGVIRVALGRHWMVGGEGYVSTLRQLRNGSYIKYGWGGLLGEFYWPFKHVMPYVGLTIGGGTQTTFLLLDGSATDWTSEQESVFHKQGFCAITPFVGCDFILTKAVHLTLKADWMNSISRAGWIKPTGPRFYFGVIFYH